MRDQLLAATAAVKQLLCKPQNMLCTVRDTAGPAVAADSARSVELRLLLARGAAQSPASHIFASRIPELVHAVISAGGCCARTARPAC
jgi:hypothetical protein